MFTDVVDSTSLTERLGDTAASALWAEYDRIVRALLRRWGGREIDKSDGFLLMFESVDDAVRCAGEMHAAHAAMPLALTSRAGIHCGTMHERANSPADVAMGAKQLELDGIAKAVAARIMALARGGQTLLSEQAHAELRSDAWQVQSHGHWRLKGLAEPLEIFEVGAAGTAFMPPPDSTKAYRVAPAPNGSGWTPVAALPHNLPAERDRFVGRQAALRAIATRLDDGGRLVSVLGAGGMGKTRLALTFARQWLGDYPGGAWFCDLASATSQDGVVHAVAAGLDVRLGRVDPVEDLGAAISARGECLVVLDNFEQVACHAEATLGRWLDLAQRARFLVTTREVLDIPGEQVYMLPPLPLTEAVELFEHRARGANHGGAVADAGSASVASLVDLLDRLPLAIELAAARARGMSVPAMIERMGQRFRLLGSHSGRGKRQATLRAAIDWSWELLGQQERSVLAQLSVFEGGFSLRDAEAVVHLPLGHHPWIVDALLALVDKSLVRRVEGQRLGLLRSVRDYAAERLLEGGPALVAAAQARHFGHFGSFDEARATAERCADIDNLVVATRRAIAAGDLRNAAGALAGAWFALRLTGPMSAAIGIAEEVAAAGRGTNARAVALWVVGSARHMLGQSMEARRLLQQALQIADDQTPILGRIQCALGAIELGAGDPQGAAILFRGALDSARVWGEAASECRALTGLGNLADVLGRAEEAKFWYESALEVARTAGDQRWEGAVLGNLAQLHHQRGDLVPARRWYDESLELVLRSGDHRLEGHTRCNLGLLHLEQGHVESAAHELQSALAIARRIGHVQLQGVTESNLGLLKEAAGHAEEAAEHFSTAVDVSQRLGYRRDVALNLAYLGRLWARSGRVQRAAECLARADAMLSAGESDRVAAILGCAIGEQQLLSGRRDEAVARLGLVRAQVERGGFTHDTEVMREVVRLESALSRS